MSDDEAALLRACEANPGDALVRLVYADWLDERGDPRGLYLRQESAACDIATAGDMPTAWLMSDPAAGLNPEWVATAGVRCDVFLMSVVAEHTITAIKMIRAVTGLGLGPAKHAVDIHLASRRPVLVATSLPLREAVAAQESIVWGSWPTRPASRHARRVATASVRRAGTEPAGQFATMTASSPALSS